MEPGEPVLLSGSLLAGRDPAVSPGGALSSARALRDDMRAFLSEHPCLVIWPF